MTSSAAKAFLRLFVPAPALRARRALRKWWRELPLTRLQFSTAGSATRDERRLLIQRINRADAGLLCAHTPGEVALIVGAILAMPLSVDGVIVEAGCFKGGSTAKLSLAASTVGRRLVVFDSFAGLPDHGEQHGATIFGEMTDFYPGRYAGRLDEVRANVEAFGSLAACEFVEGWFDDTLPGFRKPVAVAFIDVDLASSTRTCLKYLYPRLVPGGSIFSHDGHLPLVLDALRDDAWWREEVGARRPDIPGLGRQKLIRITKPLDA